MAYVKMKKGNLYANIFDSPEMIESAKADGYVLVKEEPRVEAPKEVKKEEGAVEETPKATSSKTSRVRRQ